MTKKAFQDYYADDLSHCYGCGRLNDHGLKLKSYWDNDKSVAIFHPRPYHTAFPGYVYGGLIASLIDCHGVGTAAAAANRREGRDIHREKSLRFVTASLHVDYLKPTPMGVPLEIRGTVEEINDRKVLVSVKLSAEGKNCANGRVVAVKMPEDLITQKD